MTELIADVKEWERRMHLREFFFDQNEKEDVLTDDQKQYTYVHFFLDLCLCYTV
jgi:hypothetical protein